MPLVLCAVRWGPRKGHLALEQLSDTAERWRPPDLCSWLSKPAFGLEGLEQGVANVLRVAHTSACILSSTHKNSPDPAQRVPSV